MNDFVPVELVLHRYKMEALEAAMDMDGLDVETYMQERLIELYTEMVPEETQREIRRRIDAEYTDAGQEQAAVHPAFSENADEQKPDLRVRDILPLLTGNGLAFLAHEETDTRVWPEDLRKLTAVGREDYAALLNARVSEICPSSEGLEVVLTDVAPEELARFNEDYDNFQEAEQAMGDMTP